MQSICGGAADLNTSRGQSARASPGRVAVQRERRRPRQPRRAQRLGRRSPAPAASSAAAATTAAAAAVPAHQEGPLPQRKRQQASPGGNGSGGGKGSCGSGWTGCRKRHQRHRQRAQLLRVAHLGSRYMCCLVSVPVVVACLRTATSIINQQHSHMVRLFHLLPSNPRHARHTWTRLQPPVAASASAMDSSPPLAPSGAAAGSSAARSSPPPRRPTSTCAQVKLHELMHAVHQLRCAEARRRCGGDASRTLLSDASRSRC